MSARQELTLTMDDHRAVFTGVSFLLEIVAATVSQLMGSATASVGRIACRHFARKVPVTLVAPTLQSLMSRFQVAHGRDRASPLLRHGLHGAQHRVERRRRCGAEQRVQDVPRHQPVV